MEERQQTLSQAEGKSIYMYYVALCRWSKFYTHVHVHNRDNVFVCEYVWKMLKCQSKHCTDELQIVKKTEQDKDTQLSQLEGEYIQMYTGAKHINVYTIQP